MKFKTLFMALALSSLSAFAQKKNEFELRIVSNSVIDNSYSTFGTDFVYRYKVGEKFRTGIGLGVNATPNITTLDIPLFLSEKISFKTEGLIPYLNIEGGINLHDVTTYTYTYANPRFGIEIPLKRGTVLPEVGFKYDFDNHSCLFTMSIGYRF